MEGTPDSCVKTEKISKKHPTDDELICQMVRAIEEMKTIPKSKIWNQHTFIKNNRLASVNAFRRHFGTFEAAINLAIKKIEDDGLKIYYQDRRCSKS